MQVSAYVLANPQPPTLQIKSGAIVYDEAMQRGLDEWVFVVQAFVPLTSDLSAQEKLGLMRESSGVATSVKAAAEADKTLGGLAQDLRVTEVGEETLFALDGQGPWLGCEFTVIVVARGN